MTRREPIELPHLLRERAGPFPVCGIDEAGRGPWAGPVVAAAVILDPAAVPEGLNDSKQVPRRRRETLAAALRSCALVGIGTASVEEIDRLNILGASLLAMARAVAALPERPALALVDGNRLPDALPCAGEAVPGGDRTCLSIAAASIVAKVARDAMMAELALRHPGYGWETNMGYGTAEHAAALDALGITPHHRRGFRPIRDLLAGVTPPPHLAGADPAVDRPARSAPGHDVGAACGAPQDVGQAAPLNP
jgi:ribonuclease HII